MDPHILEIGQICFTEESALRFAENHGLITSNQVIQNSQNMPIGKCRLGRAGCDGEAERTSYFDGRRQKSYEIIRCKKCKRKRSAKNAIQEDGEIGGRQQEKGSFFAHIDSLGRSQTKLPINISLLILYMWAKDLSMIESRALLGRLIGNFDEVLVDWRNYPREVCLNALQDPNLLKMRGPEQIVQIDESLMRGRRKNNRGRLLRGNAFPAARQNYGRVIDGPWVFGLVWKRPDGKSDL